VHRGCTYGPGQTCRARVLSTLAEGASLVSEPKMTGMKETWVMQRKQMAVEKVWNSLSLVIQKCCPYPLPSPFSPLPHFIMLFHVATGGVNTQEPYKARSVWLSEIPWCHNLVIWPHKPRKACRISFNEGHISANEFLGYQAGECGRGRDFFLCNISVQNSFQIFDDSPFSILANL
jgi:hypothetical protein